MIPDKEPRYELPRRSFIAGLAALPVVGCADSEVAVVRYRVIATVNVDHKLVQASTVMEARYVRVKHSLSGAGGATRLYGEALIFDLPGGRTFFILPIEHQETNALVSVWETAILRTLGVTSGIGSLSDADLIRLSTASGRLPFQYFGRFPAFISFDDEHDPKSIVEVDPQNLGRKFFGTTFQSLEVEITDQPVTERLRARLPWLNSKQQVFERPPSGLAHLSDPLIGHHITTAHFFGSGSR
ncbi:hypothetical protein FZ934_11050 [Rhizobium grahamii]|uniref:Uncharacterized protein n=1 Tax=Rhizobium grahamii TaxID=1120045 RepID=A0A5Q0C6J3_9HYPH|nr:MULTISPECIES: hypothetical protein [Rhizobium]QFY60905.1 hypothetical protein FZ934_11050 [Rhizobium grahamii]QRM49946.1 hypothetical protein F3Y33_11840 [Rhizobium sp. BG6]